MTEQFLTDLVNHVDKVKIPGQVTPRMLDQIVTENLRSMARKFGVTPESLRMEKRAKARAKKEKQKLWKRALVNKKGMDPLSWYYTELPKQITRDVARAREEFQQWKEDFKLYVFTNGLLTWETLLELPSAFEKKYKEAHFMCERCGTDFWFDYKEGTKVPIPRTRRGLIVCTRCDEASWPLDDQVPTKKRRARQS